eukprot:TRINITY_DN27645_c0_g1_i1.p1 TRINITY_DN27645_c0_g1~~TRINITY_DN27645_c0_g1_i1.p1  ORF type:complete len:1058 (-),score=163.68 TRINITY_DN27645_c0_g1_i1:45-3218(-)
MAGVEPGWGFFDLQLPAFKSQVCAGRRMPVETKEDGVTYRGTFEISAQERPGGNVRLHFQLDPKAAPSSVKTGVAFFTTAQLEKKHALRRAASPGAARDLAERKRPQRGCEQLLSRITSTDGRALHLVRLRGVEVPDDVESFFCWRSFTAVQLRIKTFANEDGHVHDFGDIADKSVLELHCVRCKHQLQVKMQPPLGLQGLVPGWSEGDVICSASDALLERTFYAVLGAYNLLMAFYRDPSRSSVPCGENEELKTRHIAKLLQDNEMMQKLLQKCTMLSWGGPSDASVRFTDHESPKKRGMLVKAVLEVKMLLVQMVLSIGKQNLSKKHRESHDAFLGVLQEDCCAGGLESQYEEQKEAMQRLSTVVCGSFNPAEQDAAWKSLSDCVGLCRDTLLPRLTAMGKAGGLNVPSMEGAIMIDVISFKRDYTRMYKTAVETYLYKQICSGSYQYGPQVGLGVMRNMSKKPDAALRVLSPSPELDKEIELWVQEFDRTIDALENGTSSSAPSKPRGAVGLDNLGDNLCATNSMIQLLFSVKEFRETMLSAPDENGSGDGQESDARRLVGRLRRLFCDLVEPVRASASARDIATVLYKSELGEQQDCDELLHRVASLLQDGLSAASEGYQAPREAFQRLFTGCTYEVQVRPEKRTKQVSESDQNGHAANADPNFEVLTCSESGAHVIGYPLLESTSSKKFLSVPVQRGNQTLMNALQEFTSWSSTGGSDVLWTQEQFRTLPPFLIFTSRQLSAFEWEDSLNLTPFSCQATPSLHRNRYERARLSQLRNELRDTVSRLSDSTENLSKANWLSGQQLESQARNLNDLLVQLRKSLDSTEKEVGQLGDVIGDGFEEPSVKDFLAGAVDAETVETRIQGMLGANTVKKLSDLCLGVDGAEDILDELGLEHAHVQAVLDRLRERQRQHSEHMYDVHAVIVYQGRGQAGHYVCFIRQPDNTFLCFDDEHVTEYAAVSKVREAIRERSSDDYIPASVRTLVYRRCDEGKDMAVELLGPQIVKNPPASMSMAPETKPADVPSQVKVSEPTHADAHESTPMNGNSPKRLRTE